MYTYTDWVCLATLHTVAMENVLKWKDNTLRWASDYFCIVCKLYVVYSPMQHIPASVSIKVRWLSTTYPFI